MTRSIQTPLPPMAVTDIDPRPIARSIAVDQATALHRRAVADCGYTMDALESAMGKGRAYIHKVLQGDKPMSLEFTTALPADVKARHAQLNAEACGFIVVVMPASGEDAIKQLVGGLVGVLHGLPRVA